MTEGRPLLITGASGYLAGRLVPLACRRGACVAVSRRRPDRSTGATWSAADLLDDSAVARLVDRWQPSAIINAAAANPGGSDGFDVNVVGAANVARVAAAHGCRLVHVSSDIVHSGDDAPYRDAAPPSPINDYGRSKAEGEAMVLAACPGAIVVRTSLIYGLDEIDRGTAGFAARLESDGALALWDDAL
ncbi:MAG: sugar nucleotide-binding protein, partial [Acidimicrobiia bacterium]|nr:sugar nucleotide-binding protein [Acidimicrobiia bacterium]